MDDTGAILELRYITAAREAAYETIAGQDEEARTDRHLRGKEIVTPYYGRIWYPRFDPVWTILYTALRMVWFEDPNPLGIILSWRQLEERVPWERTTLRRFVEAYADPYFVPVRSKYREGWPYFRTMLQIRRPTNYHGPGDEAPWQYKPLIADLLHEDDWKALDQLSGQAILLTTSDLYRVQNAHDSGSPEAGYHVHPETQNAHGRQIGHGQIAHGPSGGASDHVQFDSQNAHGNGAWHEQNAHDPGAPPESHQPRGVQNAHPNSSGHGQIAHGRSGQAVTATAVPAADHGQIAHLPSACMHACGLLANAACMLLEERVAGTTRTRRHPLLQPEIAAQFTAENIPALIDPAIAADCLQAWGFEAGDVAKILFHQPLESPFRDEAAKWAVLWSAWGVVLWTENGGIIANVPGLIRNAVRRACQGVKKDRTMPAQFYRLYAAERRKNSRDTGRLVQQPPPKVPAEHQKRWEALGQLTYRSVFNFVTAHCWLEVREDGSWVVHCPRSEHLDTLRSKQDDILRRLREKDPQFPVLEFVTT